MNNGKSVDENLVALIAKIGEKITIGKSKTIQSTNGVNNHYLHTVVKDNVAKLAVLVSLETKEKSVDFLVHLNNLQLTFDNLLANQNKYTLTDETKKCIKEAEELKIKLDELANKNWDVEAIVNDRDKAPPC